MGTRSTEKNNRIRNGEWVRRSEGGEGELERERKRWGRRGERGRRR